MSHRFTGIVGYPVAHSRSPEIHARWLHAQGIDAEYVRLPTPPEQLEHTVHTLAARGFRGVNVTVPHKEAVIPYLDALSEEARTIGAVNTIIIEENGFLRGENTDAYGFIAPLCAVPVFQEALRAPLILGAGGAARAVAYALKKAGAARIRVANRTQEKAEILAAEFGLETVAWESREGMLAQTTLLVNTTTLGMEGKEPLTLSLAELSPAAVVYDIVYTPLETELLRAARAKGCLGIEGLPMLYYQAAKSFAHWWGVMPEVVI